MTDLSEIKDVRKRLGISQVELAKLAHVSQSLIAKIESGRIDPAYSKAQQIFEALHSLTGARELKAYQIMNKKIISLSPSDSIDEAIKKMKKFNISQIPVIEHERTVGLISETILLEVISSSKNSALEVRSVMKDPPPTISKNASVRVAVDLLKFYPIVIVVSSEGKIIGIISKADVISSAYH